MSRSSLIGALLRANRAAERSRRATARHQHAVAKSTAAAMRRNEIARTKALAQADRAARARYVAQREHDVAELNENLEKRVETLESILTAPLGLQQPRSASVAQRQQRFFQNLRQTFTPTSFNAERVLGKPPTAPRRADYKSAVPAPSAIGVLFGARGKYNRALAAAKLHDDDVFARAVATYEAASAKWVDGAAKLRAAAEVEDGARRQVIEEFNTKVAAAEEALGRGDVEGLADYASSVLEALEWPEDIASSANVALAPESRQLVVELVLPLVDVVPTVREHSYVKSKDEVKEKPRPKSETLGLYRNVVASMVLRALHELLGAFEPTQISTVALNGILETVSPSTGQPVRPCVVSVRVTHAEMAPIDLAHVEPLACLASLGASVSRRPEELAPVRPVIEFDMVDRRFVDQVDVLGALDTRPNVMDLNPFEFEGLVTNLFAKMGLDAKQTRSSRDGRVDCVAFDPRPVLGGKVVIQAKRYRHTVGVSAVRDLYGTMMNEGANKGILVTTAGYGPDAYEFAKDKPIELIDGGGLLYLLKQNGIDARIIMPEEPV